jgi:phage gpG-like protein
MAETLVVGQQELDKAMTKALAALSPENRRKAMKRGGVVLEGWIKVNIQKQGLIDTGNLRGAVSAENDSDDVVSVGPRNVSYAAIHEFGGTIRPVNAKYLAIPVTKAARYAGSPRRFGGRLHFQTVAGGGALVDEDGDIQYSLKRSVTIPARPYVRPAVDEHGKDAVTEIGDVIVMLLREAGHA